MESDGGNVWWRKTFEGQVGVRMLMKNGLRPFLVGVQTEIALKL